ncbi:MAG: hypothetical protein RH981_07635 [Arenibacter sp.]|jgi:hypothetical protein
MKKYLLLLLWGTIISCASNYGQLTYVTKLPHKLTENSGMVPAKDSTVWFVMDRGNPDKIYQVNYKGDLVKELKVKNAKNNDWEDMARDENGNVFIGDFGNNSNDRKNLAIYKIPDPNEENADDIEAQKIEFNYPEQIHFPPKKNKMFYDAEAFFYYRNNFYIITKNRTQPFNGEALLYKVPAVEGNHNAQYLGSFIPPKGKNRQVTSADISPDGKTIVLLGNGTLWVFTDYVLDNFISNGTLKTIDLGVYTQLESVSFTNNNTLLLSDEESAKTGRNLYSFVLGN